MALFKLRKAGDEPATPARQPESVEAIRRRAKHRLIGAALLVLAGIVGFPLLFDTQPRPIAVDIPIEIPDRNKAKPLPVPASAGPVSNAAMAPVVTARASESASPATKTEASPPKTEASRPQATSETAPAKPAKPESNHDAAKAQALLEGKPLPVSQTAPPAAATSEARFVVQVGAFSDAAKAREARLKVERAGLRTYVHVAETRDSKLTRVRVGPFATRAEAEKAADRIKGLDLQPKILSL